MSVLLRQILFGLNLDEGLIKTYPLEKTVDILSRDASFSRIYDVKVYDKWVSVSFTTPESEYKITQEIIDRIGGDYAKLLDEGFDWKEDIKITDMRSLLTKLNSFGYFPAFTRVKDRGFPIGNDRFNFNEIEKLIRKPNLEIEILFQQKYSEIVPSGDIPEYIYHLSDPKFSKRIEQIGLIPKKSERYDDRVYVCISLDGITPEFVERMKKYKEVDTLYLYKIKTPGLNLTLFVDPEYKDSGYFVKSNIPPKNIELIGKL